MAQPSFFKQPPSSTLADIATLTKAHLADPSHGDRTITGLASLDEAGPMHLTFFDNLKYADQLASTKAGACMVSARFEARVPPHVAVLRAAQPFRAFVTIARELYEADATYNQAIVGTAFPIEHWEDADEATRARWVNVARVAMAALAGSGTLHDLSSL